jgi:hypothetical protein
MRLSGGTERAQDRESEKRRGRAAGCIVAVPLMLIVPLLSAGCGILEPSDPKPPVPYDHTESLDGAFHKPGASEPYEGRSSCYTYQCHHVNLQGGWSLVRYEAEGELRETSAPSCYQCHALNWQVRWPERIEVLYPDGSVVWNHGGSRFVEWWAPPADSTAVYLFKGGESVAVIREMSPADGVVRVDSIPASWGTGSDFQIRVVDNTGKIGFGQRFQICNSGDSVCVTHPDTSTVFTQGGEMSVEWSCAAGVTVDIEIYDGADYLDVFRKDAGNTGYSSRTFPEAWGVGDRYRLRVIDAKGHDGFSARFRIQATPG